MKRLRFKTLLLICICLISSAVFAQTRGLPRIKKDESYTSLRARLLKSGWKPYHAPDADQCSENDARCRNRPEMHVCAGTGEANCEFLWKRKGQTVAIFTVGEDPIYSGHKFQ